MGALSRRVVFVSALAAWTWLWFFPLSGFHHISRCGVLGWAFLDNEQSDFEIRWSLLLLILSVAVWLGGVAVALTVRHRRLA